MIILGISVFPLGCCEPYEDYGRVYVILLNVAMFYPLDKERGAGSRKTAGITALMQHTIIQLESSANLSTDSYILLYIPGVFQCTAKCGSDALEIVKIGQCKF